jgi:hypothetical protein
MGRGRDFKTNSNEAQITLAPPAPRILRGVADCSVREKDWTGANAPSLVRTRSIGWSSELILLPPGLSLLRRRARRKIAYPRHIPKIQIHNFC